MMLDKFRSVLVSLAVLCVLFAGVPAAPQVTTQSEAAKEGKQLPPAELYEAAWLFISNAQSLGVDTTGWQDWRHKFDGQLTNMGATAAYFAYACDTLKGPKVELDWVSLPPAEASIGLGFQINNKKEVEVDRLVRGGPAALAGMKLGDVITHVDGLQLPSWRYIVDGALMGTTHAGTNGSSIRLQYRRNGQDYDVTMQRTKSGLQSAAVCLMIDGVGYFRAEDFTMSDESLAYMEKALTELSAAGARGLVLDLRDSNVSATKTNDFAGYFLPKDAVLYVAKPQTGATTPIRSELQPILTDLPMVVLANRGTTGNSELVAAALKHHKRARIVGEQTGGVPPRLARTHELDRMFLIRVWNKELLEPDGRSLEGTGVAPDQPIPSSTLTKDDSPWYQNVTPSAVASPDTRNKDNQIADKQLRAAITLLAAPRAGR